MNQQAPQRIESIDAIRAFALFGILIVHTCNFYGFTEYAPPLTNAFIQKVLTFIFEQKCRTLFSILFGVSFFLILRNPAYSKAKFRWRCTLLLLFGLVNQLTYTCDILFWYGLNGILMSLIPKRIFRHPSLILSLAGLLYTVFLMVDWSSVGLSAYANTLRYSIESPFTTLVSYPPHRWFLEGLYWNVYFNGTSTLAYFLFGYWLGTTGYIEKLDHHVTFRLVCFYGLLWVASFFFHHHYLSSNTLYQLTQLAGTLFYGITFVFVYNRHRQSLHFLNHYGKLGLTNYSLQNICMPLCFALLIIPLHLSMNVIYAIALLFFALQCAFSYVWLKYCRFGPLEYLWRCATNLDFSIPNRRIPQR